MVQSNGWRECRDKKEWKIGASRSSSLNEVIGLKWFYEKKYAVNGSIQKQKTRLVEKGFA